MKIFGVFDGAKKVFVNNDFQEFTSLAQACKALKVSPEGKKLVEVSIEEIRGLLPVSEFNPEKNPQEARIEALEGKVQKLEEAKK